MTSQPDIHFEGNLAFDPRLGETLNGRSVANMRVLVTPTRWNQETRERTDMPTQAYDVEAFGDQADNIAASLARGMRVVVVGRVREVTTFERSDGTHVPRVSVTAESVSPSLAFATAAVHRRSGKDVDSPWRHPVTQPQPPAEDPWGERLEQAEGGRA